MKFQLAGKNLGKKFLARKLSSLEKSYSVLSNLQNFTNQQSEAGTSGQQTRQVQVQGQQSGPTQGQRRVVRVIQNGQFRKMQVVTNATGGQQLLGNQQQVVLNNRKVKYLVGK